MINQTYAVVQDGKVVEIRQLSEAPNVDQSKLAPHKPRLLPLVEQRETINPERQTYGEAVDTVEAKRVVRLYPAKGITLAERKEQLLRRLADKRWQVETGGVKVGDMLVPTDRDTQSIVDRAVAAFADGDISGVIDFKTPQGFVQIDETTMRTIKAAGAQHIQACFTQESTLTTQIEAAKTHDALDAVDISSGWGE